MFYLDDQQVDIRCAGCVKEIFADDVMSLTYNRARHLILALKYLKITKQVSSCETTTMCNNCEETQKETLL